MTAFDPIAPTYDRDFTQSLVGIRQRQAVRKYLERFVPHDKPLRILELGCGTGEDAIFLAHAGHYVLAVDISEKMISVARAKAGRLTFPGEISFQVMDMRKLDGNGFDRPFDLVFSNFGALNCIGPGEMGALFASLNRLLTGNGRVIAMLMPAFCLWESMYFTLKGQWPSVFRRKKHQGINASLGTSGITTWYYSPAQIQKHGRPYLEKVRSRPVGFFLPPSYLNPFFYDKRGMLDFLAGMERLVSGISILSGASDHYIIEWRRKE